MMQLATIKDKDCFVTKEQRHNQTMTTCIFESNPKSFIKYDNTCIKTYML